MKATAHWAGIGLLSSDPSGKVMVPLSNFASTTCCNTFICLVVFTRA